MRITFTVEKSKGPRVIPLIPDLRLCRLEGRNGIGKTMAARLLELATGENPYRATPNAWATLKEQLGPVRIVVGDVQVDHTPGGVLIFALDPDLWPTAPEALDHENLGECFLNDERITFERAATVLRAFRVGGEETLRETLVSELAVRRQELMRIAARIDARLAEWDFVLASVQELTAGLRPESLDRAVEQLLATGLALDRSMRALREQEEISAHSQSVRTRVSELATAHMRGLQLLESLEVGRTRLAEAASIEDEAASRAAAAAAAVESSAEAKTQLRAAESRRRGRVTRLRSSEIDELRDLRELGFADRVGDLDRKKLLRQVSKDLAERISRRDTLDAVEPLKHVVADVVLAVRRASPRLLDLELITDPPLTIAAAQLALDARYRELASRPSPGEVQALNVEIGELERRVQLLDRLPQRYADTDRKRDLLRESDQELAVLAKSLGLELLESYNRARELRDQSREERVTAEIELREVEAELTAVVIAVDPDANLAALDGPALTELVRAGTRELAARTSQLRTGAPASVREGLVAAVEIGGSAPSDWPRLVIDAEQWAEQSAELLGAATSAFEAALDAAHGAERDLLRLRLELLEVLKKLNSEERWRALASAMDDFLRAATGRGTSEVLADHVESAAAVVAEDQPLSADERAIAALCERLHDVAARLSEDALSVRKASDDAAAYIAGVEARVSRAVSSDTRSAGMAPSRVAGHDAARSWLEHALARVFAPKELRDELFDKAERVEFALDDLAVRWQDSSGVWQKRPLEAFSSGEQAFAYTRARLELLKHKSISASNVLLFLDEFGAFVARDRLGALMKFIEHEALEFAQQAVVMLPLGGAYPPTQRERPAGDGPEPGESLSEQVRKWGYYCDDALQPRVAP